MPLLDRLGLAPKPALRPRLAGLRLEGRLTDPARRALTSRQVAVRVALVAALAALALVAFPNVSALTETSSVGDVWQGDDVVAPFDFSIRLPAAAVAARRDSVRRAEPVIVTLDATAADASAAEIARIDADIDTAFATYAGWHAARDAGDRSRAAADSARYLRALLGVPLATAQWTVLLQSATPAGTSALAERVVGEAGRVARTLVERGVADVPRDSLLAPGVLVRNPDPLVRTEEERDARSVVASDEVDAATEAALAAAGLTGDPLEIAAALARRAVRPSLGYDREATARRRTAIVESVLPTAGRVLRSTTVIRRGDIVTAEKADQLRSLDLAQRDRSGVSWAQTVLGRALLVLAALVPFVLFLLLLRPGIYGDTRKVGLVALILGATIAGYFAAGIAGGETRFAVPVSLAVVLLTIAFDSRVGSFATITLALVGGLVFGFDFEFMFATLIVGILAVFSVRDVKSRSQLLASAGLVAAAYAVLVTAYALLRADPFTDRFVDEALAAAAHALLLLLAAPLLWGIERAFGVTTDLTLLELSDTNRPLLKELSVRAPGTFNHALQVANLAEAAADAIGANALRARVGALYHDIGKMLKPEYFVENQRPGENPHAAIKPSMSALVIAAHVRDGIDLGRQNRLPQTVLDFIATHHGTSVMEYFFRKAEEQNGPEDAPVDPGDYRYPGPRPFTNEHAIVMLADSVEAASRSLDRPTPRRLESLVESIVASRIAAGQLDTSSLTFQDVARIKDTFLAMLSGIYHFRVKYPGQAPERDDEEPVAHADLRDP